MGPIFKISLVRNLVFAAFTVNIASFLLYMTLNCRNNKTEGDPFDKLTNPLRELKTQAIELAKLEKELCNEYSSDDVTGTLDKILVATRPLVRKLMLGDFEPGGEKMSINIALSVDQSGYKHMPTLMNSVLVNTRSSVQFYISVCGVTVETVQTFLSCHKFDMNKINIVEFHQDYLDDTHREFIKRRTSGQWDRLSSYANYARFFFHRLFPAAEKALSLDVDIAVSGDVARIWKIVHNTSDLIIPFYPKYNLADQLKYELLTLRVDRLYEAWYGKSFNWKNKAFNGGAFVVNLKLWRKRSHEIARAIHFWMEEDSKKTLFKQGTQPLMWVLFNDISTYISEEWYNGRLGYGEARNSTQTGNRELFCNSLSRKLLSLLTSTDVIVMHWSGHKKPWNTRCLLSELWKCYTPPACD